MNKLAILEIILQAALLGDHFGYKPIPPQAPPIAVDPYTAAYDKSISQQCVLVLGVGCDVPKGLWVDHREESPFYEYQHSIVVFVPDGQILRRQAVLPIGASARTIMDAVRRSTPQSPQSSMMQSSNMRSFSRSC